MRYCEESQCVDGQRCDVTVVATWVIVVAVLAASSVTITAAILGFFLFKYVPLFLQRYLYYGRTLSDASMLYFADVF